VLRIIARQGFPEESIFMVIITLGTDPAWDDSALKVRLLTVAATSWAVRFRDATVPGPGRRPV
jgi:hypothetical protein